MLTEKTWKPEYLLRLVASMMLCYAVVGLISTFILSERTPEREFAATIFFSLCLHVGGLVLVAFFLRSHAMTWGQGFGFGEYPIFRAAGLGVMSAIMFLPVAFGLAKVSELLLQSLGAAAEAQESVQRLQQTPSALQQIFFGVLAVGLAPVVEEIFFRGLFYTALKQAGYPRLALLGSSLVFGIIHNNLTSFIPLTVFAMFLIWLYEKTGNLISCIVAHASFNLINFLFIVNPEWVAKIGEMTRGLFRA